MLTVRLDEDTKEQLSIIVESLIQSSGYIKGTAVKGLYDLYRDIKDSNSNTLTFSTLESGIAFRAILLLGG